MSCESRGSLVLCMFCKVFLVLHNGQNSASYLVAKIYSYSVRCITQTQPVLHREASEIER